MTWRCLACFALAVFIAVGPAFAQGVVPGRQPEGRVRVDPRTPPWTSIGKLQAVAGSLRVTCTAARIGPSTVLSAAHCLFNARTGRYFLPDSLHFVAGLEGQGFVAAALASRLQPAPDFDPADPTRTRGSDWALIELAGPLSESVPPLSLAPAPPPASTEVMVGGYAQDHPNVLTADTLCHITGLAADEQGRRMLRHDCSQTHGVSGAPLLARTESGWIIVGINVARAASGTEGLAVTLDEVRRRR